MEALRWVGSSSKSHSESVIDPDLEPRSPYSFHASQPALLPYCNPFNSAQSYKKVGCGRSGCKTGAGLGTRVSASSELGCGNEEPVTWVGSLVY